MSTVRVADIARILADEFPPERAEPWDRIGLLAGDPEATVTGVAFALDPSLGALDFASDVGANVLVTHHPAYLTAPDPVVAGGGDSGTIVFRALARGISLINAHTNLDRDMRAQRLIPDLLELDPISPLETGTMSSALVTVFSPLDAAERVVDAMVSAGAGRIGDYRGCSFVAPGTGTFTPPAIGHPYAGHPGEPTRVDEVRVEMVCPRALTASVVRAATAAHPYEEPLIAVASVDIPRNGAALGMVSGIGGGQRISLADLASRCARVFGVRPRVWGSPEAQLSLVATATGSAGSLVEAATRARVDALVAGEVRYHDALNAVAAGIAIIDVGHDASEWPLMRLLESVVRSRAGIPDESIALMAPSVGWWSP